MCAVFLMETKIEEDCNNDDDAEALPSSSLREDSASQTTVITVHDEATSTTTTHSLIAATTQTSTSSSLHEEGDEENQHLILLLQAANHEHGKTLIAFIFLLFGWFCTTLSLIYSHDRIPLRRPLRDVVFENIAVQHWALKFSEYIIVLGTVSVIAMVVAHKYHWIVFRRIALIVGFLYWGRSVTMLVTGVPPPDIDYPCEQQLKHLGSDVVITRIIQFLMGGGMSFRGLYTLCGDYIYSGHTCILVVWYLLLREYAPSRLWLFTTLYGALSCVGIVFILISRFHYTIDVVVAYWLTTRTFWIYHTMACNVDVKFPPRRHRSAEDGGGYERVPNYLALVWWYPIFRYLEGSVPCIPLPNQYEWPKMLIFLWPPARRRRHRQQRADACQSTLTAEA